MVAVVVALAVPRAPASPRSGSIDAIDANPAGWTGMPVILSGAVDRVIDNRTYVLRNGRVLGADQILLIASVDVNAPLRLSPPGATPLLEADFVQATGVVKRFDSTEALKSEAKADISETEFAPFARKPVLLATEVTYVGRADLD